MAEPSITKTCRVCKQVKSVEMFDRSPNNVGGYAGLCKDCRRDYYRANADRYKAHAKRYRAADPEATKRRDAEMHAKHREKRLAQRREWAVANAEKVREYQKRYVAENREYFRAAGAKRRARINESTEHHTGEDIQQLLVLQRGCCPACKKKMGKKYHVDHIVPLARGGGNGRDNIQLLCQPCNNRKYARDPIEFMQSRGHLL